MPSNVLGALCERCHFNHHKNTMGWPLLPSPFQRWKDWGIMERQSNWPPITQLVRAELACRPRQPRHHVTRSCHLPVSSGRGQFSSFLFLSTVWWPPCRTVSLQLSKGQVGLKWSVCQVPRGTTEEEPYIRKTVFYPWGLVGSFQKHSSVSESLEQID